MLQSGEEDKNLRKKWLDDLWTAPLGKFYLNEEDCGLEKNIKTVLKKHNIQDLINPEMRHNSVQQGLLNEFHKHYDEKFLYGEKNLKTLKDFLDNELSIVIQILDRIKKSQRNQSNFKEAIEEKKTFFKDKINNIESKKNENFTDLLKVEIYNAFKLLRKEMDTTLELVKSLVSWFNYTNTWIDSQFQMSYPDRYYN